jgi:hypothetical protein
METLLILASLPVEVIASSRLAPHWQVLSVIDHANPRLDTPSMTAKIDYDMPMALTRR